MWKLEAERGPFITPGMRGRGLDCVGLQMAWCSEGTGLKGPHCPSPQQWGRLGREGGVAPDHTQGAGLGSWPQKTHCLTWAPGEGAVS